VPTETAVPTSQAFGALKRVSEVELATRSLSQALAASMGSKSSAKPGIVFGFRLLIGESKQAIGVVKADLESSERFFMNLASDESWSIDSVNELLPPPEEKFAKFAISPRPKQSGLAGVRDLKTSGATVADYFLEAIGVTIPRSDGGKLAVAQAAKQSGYQTTEIRQKLDAIDGSVELEPFVEMHFPDISERKRRSLTGSPQRPRTSINGDDVLLSTWSTANPHFSLTVDEADVDVQIAGRIITVTLPVGHDRIAPSFERKLSCSDPRARGIRGVDVQFRFRERGIRLGEEPSGVRRQFSTSVYCEQDGDSVCSIRHQFLQHSHISEVLDRLSRG
jgi:hypothetical protein